MKTSPCGKRYLLTLYRIMLPLVSLLDVFKAFIYTPKFIMDLRRFKAMGGVVQVADLWPCLMDRTSTTAIDSHYFYQAVWAGHKIHSFSAEKHIDVGSDVRYVGMLTTMMPVQFVDIRPLPLELPNYEGINASILNLPYDNASISSLSCLHVIEHIGLGRYGDPLDPDGSLKACRELQRVLSIGGQLLVSMPIGASRVQFNGQRVFTVRQALEMFSELLLVELAIVDGAGVFHSSVSLDDERISLLEQNISTFGLGMFYFTRKENSDEHE